VRALVDTLVNWVVGGSELCRINESEMIEGGVICRVGGGSFSLSVT
jgi:hypothetical protein